MKNKICINVYIPVLETAYDIFIPKNKKLKTILIVLNKALNQMSDGLFPIKNNLTLIKKNGKNDFNVEKTIYENNIKNNQYFILL